MRLPLHIRYTLAAVALILGLGVLLPGGLEWQARRALTDLTRNSVTQISQSSADDLKERTLSFARFIASTLDAPVYELRFDEIGHLMDAVTRQPGIVRARLFDRSGRVLHDGSETLETYGVQLDGDGITAVIEDGGTTVRTDKAEQQVHVVVPVRIGSEILGGLALTVSTAGADESLRKQVELINAASEREKRQKFTLTVALILICVVVALVVGVILARNLTRPITALAEFARRIGAGEQGLTVEVKRRDEVGMLAHALNTMSKNLKESTVSKDFLHEILNGMMDPLLVVGRDGHVEAANSAAALMLTDGGDLKDKNIADFIGIGQRGTDMTRLEGYYETVITTPAGQEIPVLVACARMAHHGSPAERYVWVARDITGRKRIERELIESRDRSEAANLAKSQFLANMSHELRTPLNSIIGFAELMSRGDSGGDTPEKFKDYSADIENSGRYLLDLINDILDLARIDANKFELQEEAVDIDQVVRRSWLIASGKPESHRVEFTVDIVDNAYCLIGDRRRIQQILINLFTNALKFTDDGGKVGLEAKLDDTGCVIVVTDTGIGIAGENLERVMARFGQVAHSYSREQGGLGLGLTLTKSLVELHGGTIRLESELGVGTSCIIELPASRVRQRRDSGRRRPVAVG